MPAPLCMFRLLSSGQAEWLSVDGDLRQGSLAELAAQAAAVHLILVAPGEAVTLHRIPLPSRKRALWARAVPYALEDQLIDDIEDLHFALGLVPDGDHLPVATVAHEALRGWQEACSQAGLVPAAVIPDVLLVPWQEGDGCVLADGPRQVVRTGRWSGFVTEPETLGDWLEPALLESGEAQPRRLRVWGNPPASPMDRSWQIEHEPVGALRCFAAGYRPDTVINLLQGAYGRQTAWRRTLQPWRAAALLAVGWLFVQGATQIYEYGRLQQEQTALRAAIDQVFRDAVPGVTRIVNPRAQLEARLRELAPVGAGGAAFLDLLSIGGQSLVSFPDMSLRGISYREGQLELMLEGGNPVRLDQLRQQLEQPGIQAEMRTTQREGRMESKVTLKKVNS